MVFLLSLKTLLFWCLSHWEVWFWPVLTAALTFAVKRKYPERWEAWALKWPLGAALIEFMRAFGFDSQKGPVILQRYAMRRAGMVPDDAFRTIPIPDKVKRALLDPATRHRLLIAAEVLLNRPSDAEDLPGGTPSAPPVESASAGRSPGSPEDARPASLG
jgi:hypothetical protein